MKREAIIQRVARRIGSMSRQRPLLVGIDGIDCAGKTTFSRELAQELQSAGLATLTRSSIDGFHRSQKERYARGSLSAEGFYLDSFDYDRLAGSLLRPLKHGTLPVAVETACFDWRSDEPAVAEAVLGEGSLLLFEGIFLFRPEIVEFWDLKIFLEITFDTSLERGLRRDGDQPGTADSLVERYRKRYTPGQMLYLDSVRPKELADIVIDNNDTARPFLL